MKMFTVAALISALTAQLGHADEKVDESKYGAVEGKIIMAKGVNLALPRFVRQPIPVASDEDKKVCENDKDFKSEQWVIDPKTRGLRDVFVWIGLDKDPTGKIDPKTGKEIDPRDLAFPQDKIHPDLIKLARPSEKIDQPCCRFIPHALGIRVGQELVIANSSTIPHNAKFDSINNGAFNPLLAPKGNPHIINIKALEDRHSPCTLLCSIHPWMKADIQVFDHPYFAVTDAEGNFKIPKVPAGKWHIWYSHESGYLGGAAGRFGYEVTIEGGKIKDASREWTPKWE